LTGDTTDPNEKWRLSFSASLCKCDSEHALVSEKEDKMNIKQAIAYLKEHGFEVGHESHCRCLSNGYMECNCKAKQVKHTIANAPNDAVEEAKRSLLRRQIMRQLSPKDRKDLRLVCGAKP